LGIKEVLTPIYTGKSKLTGDSEQMSNIKPKVANDECLVSMRSIITPDNEPHCFTTLFSGAMVIRSYDFLKYGVDDEYGNVMLYQLIGVPYINQKAVEVSVEWSSLSTTGLYIMLADEHIFYWIGADYFSKYTTTKYLASEEMLKKLNYIYEEEASGLIGDEKTIHYILQGMETEQFINILTKEGQYDIEMPDFESELIFKNVIIPKLPRCFCIYENGIFPEFKEPLIDEKRHEVENENMVFKEILNFDQLTLLQKGVYLFNLSSDVFMWVGSFVDQYDFFKILTNSPMNIPNNINMHIVHEFYEPKIFIDLFPDWKQRTA
jgi:hypothetical protein